MPHPSSKQFPTHKQNKTIYRSTCHSREGDGILVVLPEVEMSGEPSLDAPVLPDELDELAALGVVGVVEPAAAVHDVALLEDAEAGADDGRVREAEYLPAILERVFLDRLHEPVELLVIHGDLLKIKTRRQSH